MAVFIGIHKMEPMSEEQMVGAWNKYKEAANAMNLTAVSVDYNAEKGIAVCKTESPDLEQVKAAHEKVGVVPEEIYEVKTGQ